MRITEQEKLNESLLSILAQIGIGLGPAIIFTALASVFVTFRKTIFWRSLKKDLEIGYENPDNFDMARLVKKFYPDLTEKVENIAKEHEEELADLSAQSAIKYLKKIIKEEDRELYYELMTLDVPKSFYGMRKRAVGERNGPSNKEKLAQIKARYGESTEKRIFDRVLREYGK